MHQDKCSRDEEQQETQMDANVSEGWMRDKISCIKSDCLSLHPRGTRLLTSSFLNSFCLNKSGSMPKLQFLTVFARLRGL